MYYVVYEQTKKEVTKVTTKDLPEEDDKLSEFLEKLASDKIAKRHSYKIIGVFRGVQVNIKRQNMFKVY